MEINQNHHSVLTARKEKLNNKNDGQKRQKIIISRNKSIQALYRTDRQEGRLQYLQFIRDGFPLQPRLRDSGGEVEWRGGGGPVLMGPGASHPYIHSETEWNSGRVQIAVCCLSFFFFFSFYFHLL